MFFQPHALTGLGILWIVTILILGIALLFVWEEIKAGGSHLENKPEHENKDD